ncbi:type VI secretion system-associated protein TagF [Chitinimonas sp. BJB300]|uniref:type VI secretion system-associated protein TagF n=1 Tax=Chitinimonas sp. BJB300 TaxID=1559339 RepID=UPI0013044DED|nr:type VI secretion system-associated protein TagF [Chitinimonas sp. BJB300]
MNLTNILTEQPELYYFGKFPARGDFVRSNTGSGLMNVFDQWISLALDMLAPDPRWKLNYDAATPVRFMFVGTRSRAVVAGVLTPSMDSSERRFPFILATQFQVDRPLDFSSLAPLRLSRCWQSAELLGLRARQAASDEAFLSAIGPHPEGLQLDGSHDERLFAEWLQVQTIEQIDRELRTTWPEFSLRRTALALGVLLQPVIAKGATNLNKGLMFPLPSRADTNAYLASFWLGLVAGFLQRHEFELSALLSRRGDQSVLLVGFSGAASEALAAVVSPDVAEDYLIDIADAEWVEEHLDSDAGCRKLASYADHPQLSLAQLRITFNEVFLGL